MGSEDKGGGEPAAVAEVRGCEKFCRKPSQHSVRSWQGLWRGEGLGGTKKGEVLSSGCVGTERGMRGFIEAGIYLDTRWPIHIRTHLSFSSRNEEPRSRAR